MSITITSVGARARMLEAWDADDLSRSAQLRLNLIEAEQLAGISNHSGRFIGSLLHSRDETIPETFFVAARRDETPERTEEIAALLDEVAAATITDTSAAQVALVARVVRFAAGDGGLVIQ